MPTQREISAVFLDAGNTLIHTPLSRSERLVSCLSHQKLPIQLEEAELASRQADKELLGDGDRWIGTPEEEAAFWSEYRARLLALLGFEDPSGHLTACVDEQVKYTRFMQPYPDVRRALTALKGSFRLGLISNAFPSLKEVMETLDLARFFDGMVISAFAGIAKPDPAIYRMALDLLRVTSEASVFVDDLPENLAAAQEMGFHVYLIDRNNRHPDTVFPRVTDLMELVEHLGHSQKE